MGRTSRRGRPGRATTPGRFAFLDAHGLAGPPADQRGDIAVGPLLGARLRPSAVSRWELAESRRRPRSVSPSRTAPGGSPPAAPGRGGEWTCGWTDAEHAATVEKVRGAIARGDVYQANVVGHRSAVATGDLKALRRGGSRDAARGVVRGEHGGGGMGRRAGVA